LKYQQGIGGRDSELHKSSFRIVNIQTDVETGYLSDTSHNLYTKERLQIAGIFNSGCLGEYFKGETKRGRRILPLNNNKLHSYHFPQIIQL
jgi:hypothetical protein